MVMKMKNVLKLKKLPKIALSENNFFLVRPICLFTRMCGLNPVSFRRMGGQVFVEFSVTYSIYSFVFGFTLACWSLFGVYCDVSANDNEAIRMKDTKSTYITCCDIGLIVYLGSFGMCSSPFKYAKLWKFMSALNKIDEDIPDKFLHHHRKKALLFLCCLFTSFNFLILMDMFTWITIQKVPFWLFIKTYFPFYLLYDIVMAEQILNWHLFYYILIRLKVLNFVLAIELNSGKNIIQNDYGNFKLWMKNEDLQLIPKRVKCRNTFVENVAIKKYDKEVLTATKINTLSKVYLKICKCSRMINEHNGLSLVVLFISSIVHLTETPYFMLLEMSGNANPLFIILQMFWIIIHIVFLLIIVEPCYICSNETQKTMRLICDLLSCDFRKDIRQELNTFLINLSHCKIEFSLSGLCIISRALITTVAGTITTYLVILFQFIR